MKRLATRLDTLTPRILCLWRPSIADQQLHRVHKWLWCQMSPLHSRYARKIRFRTDTHGSPIFGTNFSQQAATQLNLLRDRPEFIWCPATGRVCQSRPDSKDSDKTWFAVIGICLICPCVACIPLKGCCGDGMLQGELHNPPPFMSRWQTKLTSTIVRLGSVLHRLRQTSHTSSIQ